MSLVLPESTARGPSRSPLRGVPVRGASASPPPRRTARTYGTWAAGWGNAVGAVLHIDDGPVRRWSFFFAYTAVSETRTISSR